MLPLVPVANDQGTIALPGCLGCVPAAARIRYVLLHTSWRGLLHIWHCWSPNDLSQVASSKCISRFNPFIMPAIDSYFLVNCVENLLGNTVVQ